MANNNKGQKKAAKGDKKAAHRSARKCSTPKIKGSKEHRGCGPIGRKLRAENALRISQKASHISKLEEQEIVIAFNEKGKKHLDEKAMSRKASVQLYEDLLKTWT